MFIGKRWLKIISGLWLCLALLLTFGLSIPSLAFAADSWNVFQHDIRHSGQSSYRAPKAPVIVWVIPFGTTGKPTTPVVVSEDGKAFVGVYVTPPAESAITKTSTQSSTGHSGIYAFSPEKRILWVSKVTGKVSGPPAIGEGGIVYAAIGNSLVALNEKDGSARWQIKINGESTGGVMVGKDGTVYVTTQEGRSLYAVLSTGKIKWKYTGRGQVDSSPAIGSDGTIYFTTRGLNLYAISPNGSLKWRYKVTEKSNRLLTSPALAMDDTVYFGASRDEGISGKGFLYAVGSDGRLKWRFETKGKKVTMPAVTKDGDIIIGCSTLSCTEDESLTAGDSYIQAINPDGTLKWEFKTRDELRYAPVIDADGDVYVSSPDRYLTCLTKEGTMMRWRAKIGDKISIGPKGILYITANSSIAAVGEKVFGKDINQVHDNLGEDESRAGSAISLLIYAIPVIVVLGIVGYLVKLKVGPGPKDKGVEGNDANI
ncbi:MAG: PQQ-like beta-propeller repeat protein [Actinobacteria bacterium]|nr:PQQ-like beta-propeller repeat protein [Actinomycetota bacterium]